jgi:hypothetical protein
VLRIRTYDHDLIGSDNILGEITVDLPKLTVLNGIYDGWLPIKSELGNQVGEIHIKCYYVRNY